MSDALDKMIADIYETMRIPRSKSLPRDKASWQGSVDMAHQRDKTGKSKEEINDMKRLELAKNIKRDKKQVSRYEGGAKRHHGYARWAGDDLSTIKNRKRRLKTQYLENSISDDLDERRNKALAEKYDAVRNQLARKFSETIAGSTGCLAGVDTALNIADNPGDNSSLILEKKPKKKTTIKEIEKYAEESMARDKELLQKKKISIDESVALKNVIDVLKSKVGNSKPINSIMGRKNIGSSKPDHDKGETRSSVINYLVGSLVNSDLIKGMGKPRTKLGWKRAKEKIQSKLGLTGYITDRIMQSKWGEMPLTEGRDDHKQGRRVTTVDRRKAYTKIQAKRKGVLALFTKGKLTQDEMDKEMDKLLKMQDDLVKFPTYKRGTKNEGYDELLDEGKNKGKKKARGHVRHIKQDIEGEWKEDLQKLLLGKISKQEFLQKKKHGENRFNGLKNEDTNENTAATIKGKGIPQRVIGSLPKVKRSTLIRKMINKSKGIKFTDKRIGDKKDGI